VVVAFWFLAHVRRLVRLVATPRIQPQSRRSTACAGGVPYCSIPTRRAANVARRKRVDKCRYRLRSRFGIYRLLVSTRNGCGRREVFGRIGRMYRSGTIGAYSHGRERISSDARAGADFSTITSAARRSERRQLSKSDARHSIRRLPGSSDYQRGSYAVEFALVFLVFFALFYGILTFGLIFAAQQSINLAAQDGARALLRFSPTNSGASNASQVVQNRVAWVAAMSHSNLTASVCTGPRTAAPQSVTSPCTGPQLTAGQVEMVVTYPYGVAPLIPSIPFLGRFTTPVTMGLQARSVVDLGYSTTH
jgi:Flp pilus assembly protein TadG